MTSERELLRADGTQYDDQQWAAADDPDALPAERDEPVLIRAAIQEHMGCACDGLWGHLAERGFALREAATPSVEREVRHALDALNTASDKMTYGDSAEGDLLEAHATLSDLLARLRDVVHSLSDTEGSDGTTTSSLPAERDEPVTAAGLLRPGQFFADHPLPWEVSRTSAGVAIEDANHEVLWRFDHFDSAMPEAFAAALNAIVSLEEAPYIRGYNRGWTDALREAATPSVEALAEALSEEWPFPYSPPEAWEPIVRRVLARLSSPTDTGAER